MEITTPSYIFDIDKLVSRVKFIKETLGDIKISYAMKANPFLVEDLIDVVDSFEVCSPGEYQICKALNVPKDKIVLSGVFKEEKDIKAIVSECKDKPIYTIESLNQLALLDKVAKLNNLTLNVYVRVSSGNQFGVDEDTVRKIVSQHYSTLHILGLQSYTGTQKKMDAIAKELNHLYEFTQELEQTNNITFEHFEYGPGLRINYFVNEPAIDDKEQLLSLKAELEKFNSKHIQLEMGRFIAALCGEYHTTIVDMKKTNDINYCIIDGGINHLNYYGQTMAMKAPFIIQERNEGELINYTICGSLCTVADVIIRNYPLYDAKIGDELVFLNTGAYSITEGIYLFLSRDMPKVYKRKDNKLTLVRNTIHSYKINMKGEK